MSSQQTTPIDWNAIVNGILDATNTLLGGILDALKTLAPAFGYLVVGGGFVMAATYVADVVVKRLAGFVGSISAAIRT